jgi:hypothetical protein
VRAWTGRCKHPVLTLDEARMSTAAEERLPALDRALLREEAHLRRARARLAALRRANR